MKRCVVGVVVLAFATSTTGVSPLHAMAATCSPSVKCPNLPCHTFIACIDCKCHYKQLPAGDLCTGCSNGGGCDDDAKDSCDEHGRCIDKFKAKDTQCFGGACYEDAKCDGVSGVCHSVKPARAGKPCTGKSNSGDCDAPDTCDGNGKCKDNFLSGTVCAAAGSCHNLARCDGKSSKCPDRTPARAGTACTGKSNG
ncbi:hypothetical protein ACHHYP_20791, partial [Achlya hypogyna]